MALKRKIISAIISTFAVVTFTTFVSAQDTNNQTQDAANQPQKREKREKRGGMGRGYGMKRGDLMRGFEKLNLTDAQKEQIRAIMEANRPDPNEFEKIRPLIEAKRNGTITAEQEQQLKAAREQMRQKQEQVRTQIMGVLTDEQRAQLEKMKEEMRQKREERQKQRQNRQNPQDQ